MNAAALRFVPLNALKQEGYEAWIEPAGLTLPPSNTANTEHPTQQKTERSTQKKD
jgi:hypothetical protein